jgi:hypothetical protein
MAVLPRLLPERFYGLIPGWADAPTVGVPAPSAPPSATLNPP